VGCLSECRTLIATAKKRGGRYGLRDLLAIRMCWRHGLRVSELVGLRWEHVEWKTAQLRCIAPRAQPTGFDDRAVPRGF